MSKEEIISAMAQLGISMNQIEGSCQYQFTMPETINYELAEKILPAEWVAIIRQAKENPPKPTIQYYGSKEHLNDIANGRD